MHNEIDSIIVYMHLWQYINLTVVLKYTTQNVDYGRVDVDSH